MTTQNELQQEVDKLKNERADIVTALRDVCKDFGDNN